ncbi:MAG: hypothetical protein AC479_02970 [miscellaneous Crenarchaeota group-6 archaeon AD8-1]|nr:MAG: hypothetical protein AC479_02970 [miscellaneous Crenarchaeota group-6 archaeon AD8-1]
MWGELKGKSILGLLFLGSFLLFVGLFLFLVEDNLVFDSLLVFAGFLCFFSFVYYIKRFGSEAITP